MYVQLLRYKLKVVLGGCIFPDQLSSSSSSSIVRGRSEPEVEFYDSVIELLLNVLYIH